jgi:hypothetical protein
MASVTGIREKVHLPIYDSIFVEPTKQLREVETGSTLKFFVNVQGKTKLETNLQSASLLPHFNTFEARAMRVVISDLPPEFPDGEDENAPVTKGESAEGFDVTDEDGNFISANGGVDGIPEDPNAQPPVPPFVEANVVTADLELDLKRLVELLKEARESDDKEATIDIDDEGVTLLQSETDLTDAEITNVENAGGVIILSVADLEDLIDSLEKKAPPLEQIRPNDGAGNLIGKLVYNTVTTLFVGEKIMIEMPTFFFPGGAGPYSLSSQVISHGEPSPLATFRFADPIFVDRQQNFRVEIDIPDSDVHKEIQKIYGPLFVWVVLDGYMTRDVQ